MEGYSNCTSDRQRGQCSPGANGKIWLFATLNERADVRYWHLADIEWLAAHVRFEVNSGHIVCLVNSFSVEFVFVIVRNKCLDFFERLVGAPLLMDQFGHARESLTVDAHGRVPQASAF